MYLKNQAFDTIRYTNISDILEREVGQKQVIF